MCMKPQNPPAYPCTFSAWARQRSPSLTPGDFFLCPFCLLRRGPRSRSRRLRWSIIPRGSYPTPRCCRAVTAAASLRSAAAAHRRRRASKAKAANRQWLSQATAFPRSLWEKKVKPRRLTACTSGLWNAPFLYLTASPSRPPRSRRPCRPSRSWSGQTIWKTAAGGLSRFPGPGLCPAKSLSYEKKRFCI